MGMAAILGMCPEPFEQTFVSPVASEEKMIKESRRRRTTEDYLSCKLINEPSAQGS